MPTTKTPTLVHRSVRLEDGAIDREVLARAITFALDSTRAGFVESRYYDLEAKPGIVDGLYWGQDAWLRTNSTSPFYSYVLDELEDEALASDLRTQGKGCGTGCCIAGWIDIASGHPPVDEHGYTTTGVAERARQQLTGIVEPWADDDLLGLPPGVTGWNVTDAIDHLFGGNNTLPDVIDYADQLLALYGQPPLDLDATGTFR